MPLPTVWDQLGQGGDEYMMTRKLAFEKAKPLDEHVLTCLEFLRKIGHIEVTDTTQSGKSILIQVYEKDAGANNNNQAPWFTIERTRKEISKLHSTLHHWADRHIDMSFYDLPSCGYCTPLTQHKVLWPGSLETIFTTTAKRQQAYSKVLNEYVVRGRGKVDHDRVCFGMEHVPSVLTRFLLQGVDQTKL